MSSPPRSGATYAEMLTRATTNVPPDGQPLVQVELFEYAAQQYAVVTMRDEGTLNALTPELMVQLHANLGMLVVNPLIRAVILTGADPAFCSGGSLALIAEAADNARVTPGGTSEAWRWIRSQFGGVVRLIVSSNCLFVAAVNGPAAGVGLAFAMACDVVIASKEHARFVPAFGKLGLVPEVGLSWFMTRRLGYQNSMNLFLRGSVLDAEAALRAGLCQDVVSHRDLLGTAHKFVRNALDMPPHVVEMTKTLLRSAADATLEQSMRMEEFAEANCFSTASLPKAARGLLSKV